MNSVSWFIYIAGVVENVGITFVIAGFCGIIATAICWFGFAIADDDNTAAMLKSAGVRIPTWSIGLLLVCSFIPSKTTMYAIAASQIGETVVTSPEAREMIDDTKTILRDYLKSLKKDAAK